MEPRFSPRQREIVSLIASGYSDKQIALTLRVSKRTVRTQ
ncbi:MAG: response regulator transcription factor, partial [Chloroflexi bacterium]